MTSVTTNAFREGGEIKYTVDFAPAQFEPQTVRLEFQDKPERDAYVNTIFQLYAAPDDLSIAEKTNKQLISERNPQWTDKLLIVGLDKLLTDIRTSLKQGFNNDNVTFTLEQILEHANDARVVVTPRTPDEVGYYNSVGISAKLGESLDVTNAISRIPELSQKDIPDSPRIGR